MPDEKSEPSPQGLTVYEPDPVQLPNGVTWHPYQRRGTDEELSDWAWKVNDHDHGAVFRQVATHVRGVPIHQHIGHRWAQRIAGQLDMAADLLDAMARIVATDTRQCAACGHPANVHGRQCWQQETIAPTLTHGPFGKIEHIHGGGETSRCECPGFLAPESAEAVRTVASAAMDRLRRGDV